MEEPSLRRCRPWVIKISLENQNKIFVKLFSSVLIIVHTVLAKSNGSPVVPLVGQGLAYSGFAAVLWPSVPLVVEKRLIGLGYGVVTSVQVCYIIFLSY